jgi:hypothetical protein
MPNLSAFNLSEQSLSAGRFSSKPWNYVIIYILMQFLAAHVPIFHALSLWLCLRIYGIYPSIQWSIIIFPMAIMGYIPLYSPSQDWAHMYIPHMAMWSGIRLPCVKYTPFSDTRMNMFHPFHVQEKEAKLKVSLIWVWL